MSDKRRKLLLALAVLFAVNMLIITLASQVHADLYKRGASGATVTEIQTRGIMTARWTASTAAARRRPCAIFSAKTA